MKIQIGDNDPFHLSIKPVLTIIVGVALFCVGAFNIVLSAPGLSHVAAVIVGLALVAVGYRAAIREQSDFNKATDAMKREAEKKVEEAGA